MVTYFHSLNMPVRACGRASILQPLTHSHFSGTLVDTEHLIHSWFPDVSDVERRCWRISRNAILQGVKRGSIWGQRGGNVWTVKHFTFLQAESEHFYLSWERGGSEGDWWEWWQSTDPWHRWDRTGGVNEIVTLLLLLIDTNVKRFCRRKTGDLHAFTIWDARIIAELWV